MVVSPFGGCDPVNSSNSVHIYKSIVTYSYTRSTDNSTHANDAYKPSCARSPHADTPHISSEASLCEHLPRNPIQDPHKQ